MSETFERQQNILSLLSVCRFATIENLATELNVSKRTIHRDIIDLSKRYSIYTKTGRYYGGIYVVDGFVYGDGILSAKQMEFLIKKASSNQN